MKAPAIAALITQTPFLEGFEFSTFLNSYLVNLILVEVGELLYDGYAGNFYFKILYMIYQETIFDNHFLDPFLHEVCNIPFVNFVCEKILEFPERIGLFFQVHFILNNYVKIKN